MQGGVVVRDGCGDSGKMETQENLPAEPGSL